MKGKRKWDFWAIFHFFKIHMIALCVQQTTLLNKNASVDCYCYTRIIHSQTSHLYKLDQLSHLGL